MSTEHNSPDRQPPQNQGSARGYTPVEPWEALLKVVNQYDEDMVKNWKEDLDTLLVFAGLFSAVVTAFVIESYQWLSEDPADVTVVLLKQISQQLRDQSVDVTEAGSGDFRPETSSVLINCLWFLSLILALVSSLLALLCKEWLREHMRDIHTGTSLETLALRQLRRDSLDKWRVPELVATTPILLELALMFFFAGILYLSWTRHFALFLVCMIAVGLGTGLYVTTTFLPSLVNIYMDLTDKVDVSIPGPLRLICPYKSPQAWAAYHFFCMLIRQLPFLKSSLLKRGYNWRVAASPARDWPLSDMRVLAAFDKKPPPLNLNMYKLRALEWAARMFQASPSMVPHFQDIMQPSSLGLRPSVVMSAIFNHWTLAMWRDFTALDVQNEVQDMNQFQESMRQELGWYTVFSRSPNISSPVLHSRIGIQMTIFYNYWHSLLDDASPNTTVRELQSSISYFREIGLNKAIGLRFFIPFSIIGKLWAHPSCEVRQESLSLIQECKDSWNAYPGPEERGDERLAFLVVLVNHLKQVNQVNGKTYCSCLLTSPAGRHFIRFIHERIIQHQLFKLRILDYDPNAQGRRDMLMKEWIMATQSIDGLAPISGHQHEVAHPVLDRGAGPGQENSDSVELHQRSPQNAAQNVPV
ncbi:hypothetical protein Moror_8323 [Moniliophthora roreri MCA 2997]|uniref:DUF6535 domain-containing protein n=2 Tax=Moniliophthora roreri TaxID=221103 RepID=V2X4Z6_MONRO|nr:hypothetical protein Moror_8323 [Moniliophthora roreri MCA 2997]KAI3619399.1 hypothetical protein WG66_012748 [Moniliophthora roreri]